MKKRVLLLFLLSSPLWAMQKDQQQTSEEDTVEITNEQFEALKNGLPPSLKGFVEEFKDWSQEEKNKIEIRGLSFVISNLTEGHQKREGNDLGYWIDCRTNTQQKRERLIYSLQYLQR